MTCIAASIHHKAMAADTRCSSESTMVSVTKIKDIKGALIGAAGDWDDVLCFWDIVAGKGKPTDLTDNSMFIGIELSQDGLFLYQPNGKRYAIREPFYAIGTGAAYAISAMAFGMTPEEAVSFASKYDPNTGGEIDRLELGTNAKAARKRK
jgi:hypothetical protein